MISHCLQVTVLRLAVKYQLHPLPVEDTIQSLDHWLDAGCPQKNPRRPALLVQVAAAVSALGAELWRQFLYYPSNAETHHVTWQKSFRNVGQYSVFIISFTKGMDQYGTKKCIYEG